MKHNWGISTRTVAIFFVVAFLFRLGIAAEFGFFHKLDRSEVEVIALNVTQNGEYTLYGVPSAYNMPAFPLFLAALFAIFGTGLFAKAVAVVLTCTVSALRCALVPLFALDAGLDSRIALLAGWLGVFYVGSIETDTSGNVEGPYVALAMLILIWWAMRIWRDGSWRARTPWWFFAYSGFSILLSPTFLPVIGGLLAAGAIACPAALRARYFRQAALTAAGIAIWLAPWVIRNEYMLGTPVLTRSNFGFEFWVSNGDDRTFDHSYNYDVYHPSRNPAEAARLVELGEVEYSRVKLAEGMDWVRSHPASFVRLTAKRVGAWWFPPYPTFLMAPKFILGLAAFAGLWRLFRRRNLIAWLFLITWIAFPAVYYLVHWVSRYRTPMDWQIVLCACVAFVDAWQALRARSQTARDVPAAA